MSQKNVVRKWGRGYLFKADIHWFVKAFAARLSWSNSFSQFQQSLPAHFSISAENVKQEVFVQ